MKRLLQAGRCYMKNMGLSDMAALKFCLCAIGIVIGLFVPRKTRKPALIGATAVFTVTYIPLMAKLIRALKQTGLCRATDH